MAIHAYVFQKQLDGSLYEGLNCNCAVCASQIDFATGGAKSPDPNEVRLKTRNPDDSPDRTGGTRLDQMAAVADLYGVTLDVHYGVDFEQAWAWLHDPLLALDLSISYRPVHGTAFDADSTFFGNHAVGGYDGKIGDPLADHRRPGIPQALQTWPKDLVREAAGALVIGGTDAHPDRLGAGKVWLTVAHAPKQVTPPTPHPVPTPSPTVILRYGGQLRSRGAYRIKPGILALVRSTPNNGSVPIGGRSIPPGVIVTRLLGGRPLPWRVAQTTYTGASVGGDRRWHGNAAGTQWVHHSLVDPIR